MFFFVLLTSLLLVPLGSFSSDFSYFFNLQLAGFSYCFVFVVLGVSLSVFVWIYYYMKEDLYQKEFFTLTFVFLLSMFIFLVGKDFFSLFIGFDLLGVTSFLLILYYKNQDVLNNSLITLMVNKVSDVSLIILGSVFWCTQSSSLFFVFLAICVKSSQLPWNVWLPLAMSAPTPISALVHTSTLVTAGVILMVKLSSSTWWFLFVFFCSLTLGSLSAILEKDFKKLVAFSTMSQMSLVGSLFCLLTSFYSGLFHLSIHAFFKSLLFISLGNLMHQTTSSQHQKQLGFSDKFSFLTLSLCLVSMSGCFFLSGLFSKDFFLESMENSNNFLFILCYTISLFLTFLYSSKLFQTKSNKIKSPDFSFYYLAGLGIFTVFLGSFVWKLFLEEKSLSYASKSFSSIYFACLASLVTFSIFFDFFWKNFLGSFNYTYQLSHLNLFLPFEDKFLFSFFSFFHKTFSLWSFWVFLFSFFLVSFFI